MEKTFTLENARLAAKINLMNRMDNEEYIPDTTYFLVGVDNDLEHSVYAKQLSIPDIFITGKEDALNVFKRNPNSSNEILLSFEMINQKWETLFEPLQPLILLIKWPTKSQN